MHLDLYSQQKRGLCSLKRRPLILVGAMMLLAGCGPRSQTQTPAPETAQTPQREGRVATQQPAFAVNELTNGLIPGAPQMGELAVRDDCLVFVMRGQATTPLWPSGSTLELRGETLTVNVPGLATFPIPSKVTLGGAFVPLNSANMTKYSKRLPRRCPGAIFAVARQ